MPAPSALARPRFTGRRAGVTVPLFSVHSTRSWGIGELLDVPRFSRWLQAAGLRMLFLLPINETALDDPSPYAAISSMAIDPGAISMWAVEDLTALGGERALDKPSRAALRECRAAPSVDQRAVRGLKREALALAFDRFVGHHWVRDTPRAARLRAFNELEAWWLDDHARFSALRDRYGARPWWEWPEPDCQAERHSPASEDRGVLFHQYQQWLAAEQWARARATSAALQVFGDFPFMVRRDSADVWARRHQFLDQATVGAPPDAFSASGQDWGLPAMRWEAMAGDGYRWLAERGRRSAALFDGFRIDHLVGYYRTYILPAGGQEPYFSPPDEESQRERGVRILSLLAGLGVELVTEDLGTIPPFVRESLRNLDLPGYRVLRWERRWDEEGQPFIDPADYPPVSLAASGTHDTESLASWWEGLSAEERHLVLALPCLGRSELAHADDDARIRDGLLECLMASGSNLVVVPFQDLFGWRERVNVPATISRDNWSYRLPWSVEELATLPQPRMRAAELRRWAREYGRWL